MAAVDKLAQARDLPGQRACTNCSHCGAWHEVDKKGCPKIGGRCGFPGCDCGASGIGEKRGYHGVHGPRMR